MKTCGCADSTLPYIGQAFPANVTEVCKLRDANQGMIVLYICINLFLILTSLTALVIITVMSQQC